MNRDLLTYIGQQPRLPDGYREVEYLESTGEQWIDSGLHPNANQELMLDGYWTTTSSYNNICGCRRSGNIIGFLLIQADTGNGLFFNFRGYERKSGFSRDISQTRHIFVSHLYYGEQWVSVDGEIGTVYFDKGAYPDFSGLTFFIFARNQDGVANYFGEIRAYSLVISTNGITERHYIPCVRTADNKPGMYDLCGSICPLTGNSFYINSGTGADFLWGEKKPDFFPTRGLVFWNPLDKWRTRAATGQSITYAGTASSPVLPTEATYKGIPCCQFPIDSIWSASHTFKNGRHAYVGSLSCWVASNQALVKWQGSDCLVGIRTSTSGYIRYGVDWQNNLANLSAGTHDNAVTYNGYTSIPNNTNWHHYCLLLDVPETAATSTSTGWHCVLYLDGRQVWEGTQRTSGTSLSVLMFGQTRTSNSNVFSIAGIRAYNRLLHPDEIAVLSREYTPEA